MPEAVVLLNTDIGTEEEVLNTLGSIDGVVEAYIVYGVYDIVAKVQASTTEALKEIISSKIRKIPKVRSTLTMIVVEGKKFVK
ncbi:MAG: AsnC family transcriptional regulator [Desulfurococcales archaeon ex4484_204]|nr:MAG: AsnC family transcriptional regulator [Desulfurococcales archaeon ex4484_204]